MTGRRPGTAPASAPLALRALGSFHVGGAIRPLAGEPLSQLTPVPGSPPITIDPNGGYAVGAMYVQYAQVAEPLSHWPLLLWHGGGMTGACWESTPDGRPGWQSFFLRHGLDVFVCDAVERGRAGFARWPQFFPGEPFFMPQRAAWDNYRIGPATGFADDPAQRRAFAGSRFPLAAFDAFSRQLVPRWPGNEVLIQAGYDALLAQLAPHDGHAASSPSRPASDLPAPPPDAGAPEASRAGPHHDGLRTEARRAQPAGLTPLAGANRCVLLAHSQGGGFALRAALAAPQRIAALVLVEPGGLGGVDPAAFAARCRFPLLVVWGDRVADVPFWQAARQAADTLVATVAAAGGDATTLDLPAAGIAGNSHLPMMDLNSDEVAQQVVDWLVHRGICSFRRI